jgi:hypothetical protein
MADPVFTEPGSEFKQARPEVREKGLVGFLIRLRLAKDEPQANLVLVAVLALALIGIWLAASSARSAATHEGNLNEQARLHPEWGLAPGHVPLR